MMDSAPVEFLFVRRVQAIALGEKEVQGAGRGFRQVVPDCPCAREFSGRPCIVAGRGVINRLILLVEAHARLMVWQVKEGAGRPDRDEAISIQRKKPDAGNTVKENVGSDVDLVKV